MSILTTADPKKKLEQPPWVQPTGGVDVGKARMLIRYFTNYFEFLF
jgi:hypothetical protein